MLRARQNGRHGAGRVSPRQPAPQQRLDRWRQTRAAVGVSRLLDRFSLGRIGMDDMGKCAETDPLDHRQGDLVDHIASMAGNDRCTKNPVGPFLDVDFYEAARL
jgi:hypothetical protein